MCIHAPLYNVYMVCSNGTYAHDIIHYIYTCIPYTLTHTPLSASIKIEVQYTSVIATHKKLY